jgi:hypothetical protein
MKRIVCGALTALAVTTVSAEDLRIVGPGDAFFTGKDLHEYCKAGGPFMHRYVAGLRDLTGRSALILDSLSGVSKATDTGVEFGLQRPGSFCPPPRVTVEQATELLQVPSRLTEKAGRDRTCTVQ